MQAGSSFIASDYDYLVGVDYGDNITEIAEYGLYKRRNLSTINLPKNLKKINRSGIDQTAVKRLDLPNTLTNIESYGIYANYNLTELYVGENVSNINTFGVANNPLSRLDVKVKANLSYDYRTLYNVDELYFHYTNMTLSRNAFKNVKRLICPRNYLGTEFGMPIGTDTFNGVGTVLVDYRDLEEAKTRTNWSLFADKIYPIGGNYHEILTIPTTAWDTTTNTATITAIGSTAEARNIITISVQGQNTNKIKCTEQGTMQLTFSCDTIPTEDVVVDVSYMLTNY